ncbi:PLxRFG domain-containing protein [Dyella sp.]|uniref:PLxRFG domain-containing protein n=1 Tax=Dyella sp. TaxID=1869338 RepID=UPI002FD987B7
MDGASAAATPQAQLKPPSGIGGWVRSQLQGTGQQDYGQGLGYLVDNPVTRGLGGAANSVATGAAELAQRGVGVVSPSGEAWLKRNVTTPLAQRQAQFEAPQSAGLGSNVTQALSGLGAQISAAVLSGGEVPEMEGAAAAPGILSKVAPYLTRPALQGAATLGLTQAGSEAAQQEAAGQQPESTAALLGKGLFDTAANLVPMGGRGSVLKRALTGAIAGEGVNEAQNLVNGQPVGTGALLSTALGAGLGLVPHAHVPYPEAQPGSMADAANTIAESNARTSTLQRPSLNPTEASPAQPQAGAAPAPAAEQTSQASNRVAPAVPPWINPDTGEITAPTKDQLTQAMADHMAAQYAATDDMRIVPTQLAREWNVPQTDVAAARKGALKLAQDNLASAERAAMQPRTPDAAPETPGEASAATSMLGTSGDNPGQPLHPWTPVDNTKRVPYAGGVASDGRTIYLDPALPQNVKVDGKDVNAHDAVAYHESVEYPLMHLTAPMSDADLQGLAERAGLKSPDELPPQVLSDLKEGKSLDYGPAHDIATLSENKYVADHYGVDPEKYQAALQEGIDAARKEAPGSGQTPADLDAKPYVNQGESSLANGIEPTTADAANEGDGHAAEVRSDQASVPETSHADGNSGAEGSEDLQRPAQAESGASNQVQRQEEVAAKEPKTETPPVGGVAASERKIVRKPDTAAEDARSVRVKTPEGEVNGQAHVDQLISKGYNKLQSVRAGDKLVHSLVNDAGDAQRLKAKQLRYAEQATERARPQAEESPSTPAEKVESAAAQAALSPHNDLPEPTQAQKEAGNYQKGHVSLHGLDISIENPRGSTRSGQREDGSTWSHEMSDHYGYIKRTEGADGEHVDVYIGPKAESTKVYVVDQLDQKTRGFDEHKAMLGFTSKKDAIAAYKSNFDKGWKVGPVHAMDMDEFKDWLKNGDTTRPAAERTPEPEPVKVTEAPKKENKPSVAKEAPKRGGITTSGAKARVVGGKLEYIPGARETLEAYFKPGKIVAAYAGNDRVHSFDWNNGSWSVKVQEVDKDGNPLRDRSGREEPIRSHSTMPNNKELLKVLGPPKLPEKAAKAATKPGEAAPLFRKSAEVQEVTDAQRDHEDRINDTVAELTKDWKGNDLPGVHVVATADELPARFKTDPGYKTAKGAYDGKGIWLVADRHPDTDAGRADLAKTLAHEAIGHYGIDRIVGRELGADAWQKIRDSIEGLEQKKAGGDAMQRVLADVHKRYPGVDADTFARETLAVMAEKGVRNGLLDRVVSGVRQFLRKVLPSLKFNDAELRQLLAKSKDFLEHGESYAERVQGRAAMAFSRDGWSEDFPNVVTAHTPGFVREHPEYAKAKAGDGPAAMLLAKDAVTDEFVAKVKRSLPEDVHDPIVVPVEAREASGNNKIPAAAAELLAHKLGGEANHEITQLDKVSRGGSGAMHRLANQPRFGGEVERGRYYILLDDTLGQGGTLAQLKTHIEREGGRVVLATALTGKDYSRKLALFPDTLGQVRERFGRIEGWFKREFGYGYDGLTESEARTMLTYDGGRLSPDTLRDRILAKRIPDLRGLGEGPAGDRSGAEASGAGERGISDASAGEHQPGTSRSLGVTDSPEFKKFFGDSKVVDSDGKPLPVYHGTGEDFSVFDKNKSGEATGHDTSPLGHYFTPDRALAERYATNASEGRPADQRVVDAYLSVQKPYELPLKDAQAIKSTEQAQALRDKLEAEGYDGIHVPESDTWVAFHPEQIKSASENRGTFDKANPSIYFRRDVDDSGEPEEPGKPRRPFSQAAASIESMHEALPKQDAGVMQQAKDWISGKARDMEPAALGALQLRHVLELASDVDVLKSNARRYGDTFQKMDGDRNKMITDGAEKAQRLQKWAFESGPAGWRGKLKAEAKNLFQFMHQVTQLGVDPTDAYERLLMRDSRGEQMPWTEPLRKERIKELQGQMRGRSGDDKQAFVDEIKDLKSLPSRERTRQQKYPQLVAKWNALSPQAKEMFGMMRDHYREQSEDLQKAVEERINGLDIPKQNKLAAIAQIRQNFDDAKVNGVYFPLMRFGDFWISGQTKDGEYFFAKYENAKQAQEAEQRFKASDAEIEQVGRQDNTYRAKEAPSGSFIRQLTDHLAKSGAPERVVDEINQMFLKTLPELSLQKRGIHRKNVAGYTDNVPRAFASSVFHGAHQISRMRYGWQLGDTMEQMKARLDAWRMTSDANVAKASHADALMGELRRRNDWILNPNNSKLASKLSSIAFAYHLSASPVSAITYLLQMPQIVLPVLGAHHGWPAAMRVLGAATRDAIRTGGHIDRVLQGEELLAHKALQAQGTFQRTGTHTLAGLSEGDLLKSNPAWAKVMGAVSYMFHTSELINREATGMAAYRLGRMKGQSFEQAVKYADEMTNGTHGDYSNANRARYMQGNLAKIALQFKSYALAMSWLWGRNFYQAFKAESPEVRAVARKTLTGLTGMTALLAGAMGLPMYNALKAGGNAVHAVTGDPNEPWDFDTEFRGWLGEHLGDTAASLIADGAANKLGADIAGRTSMSDLWFRDADRQLEGESAYDNLLESIAGPLGAMVKNMYVGAQQYNQGNVWRGVETMMPTAAKNAMKAMRYANDGVNTLKGDPIVPDISVPEDLIQAMGFTPTRVADQMRLNSALENYSQQIQSRRTSLMNAFAMATAAGDQDGQSDVISKIQDFNQANPEIAIRMSALRDSMRTRAQHSEQAVNGIVLNKRIASSVREAVGVDQ